MGRRSENGKKMISLHALTPASMRRDDDFDPVLTKWSDPATCSDAALKKLLCDAGAVPVCPLCECFEKCQYGRELVRRAKCRQVQRQSQSERASTRQR